MSVERDLVQMSDMMATGRATAMAVLLGEMKALAALMPGQARAGDEASRRAAEAAVEEQFDNMPV